MPSVRIRTCLERDETSLCDVSLVGMSIVHEVTLAAHCGFRTLGLALITNKCLSDYNTTHEPVHEDVIRISELKAAEMQQLILDFVGAIQKWEERESWEKTISWSSFHRPLEQKVHSDSTYHPFTVVFPLLLLLLLLVNRCWKRSNLSVSCFSPYLSRHVENLNRTRKRIEENTCSFYLDVNIAKRMSEQLNDGRSFLFVSLRIARWSFS